MTAHRPLIAAFLALVVATGCSPKPGLGSGSAQTQGSSQPPSSTSTSSSSTAPAAPPTWQLAEVPKTEPTSVLWDVAAADATHAWAVGSQEYSPAEQYTTGAPLVLFWKGSEWSPVTLPALSWKGGFRLAAAGSLTDVWILGDTLTQGGGALAVRGDGTTWNVVTGLPNKLLPGVTVDTDGIPWMIGNSPAPSSGLNTYQLPGQWNETPAPTPPDTVGMRLNAITAIPGTNRVVAVGAADLPTDPKLLQAVILEYKS